MTTYLYWFSCLLMGIVFGLTVKNLWKGLALSLGATILLGVLLSWMDAI